MKKVYVAHSTAFDFKKELYEPLKKINNIDFLLPHEGSMEPSSSKETIKKCSFLLAEVSMPSHGVGIELNWADAYGIPIIFIFRKGSKISPSLKLLSDEFIEYENIGDIAPYLKRLVIK